MFDSAVVAQVYRQGLVSRARNNFEQVRRNHFGGIHDEGDNGPQPFSVHSHASGSSLVRRSMGSGDIIDYGNHH